MSNVNALWGSLLSGIVFGIGWIIFVDQIAYYNSCRESFLSSNTCGWKNTSEFQTAYSESCCYLQCNQRSNLTCESTVKGTCPGPDGGANFACGCALLSNCTLSSPVSQSSLDLSKDKYGGWKSLTGNAQLVYLPAILILLGFFMINTVESSDLTGELEYPNNVFIKVWFFTGSLIIFTSLAISLWLLIDVFAKDKSLHVGPGVGTVVQVSLVSLSCVFFWIARRLGEDSPNVGF
mmetsp:Transcript_5357/g.12532  ORF Transcript_5357/g.12532 Transcript_5357/m.12532 type:complete len:235 (-) Transcript_5357:31-735(-)